MRIHTISLTLVATAALFGCGKATQPKPTCRAQQNLYAARFLEPEATGMCDGKMLEGEVMHLAVYRSAPVGGVPKVGIEPASIADAVQAAEAANVEVTRMPQEYSLGSFRDAYPNDKDICEAPRLSEAAVEIPEIPANPAAMPPVEAKPAVSLKYKWSKMQFITQPLSNAIHFGADLERTDGDCTVKYKVSAIYPVIHCGDGKKMEEHTDEMGNKTMVEVDDPTSGNPVADKCKPSIKGDKSGTGSGLSPDYEYECVPGIVTCMPTKEFPAFVK